MIKDQKDEVPVNFPYADILDHPRHISRLRKPMDISKRAAQFMPFDDIPTSQKVKKKKKKSNDISSKF